MNANVCWCGTSKTGTVTRCGKAKVLEVSCTPIQGRWANFFLFVCMLIRLHGYQIWRSNLLWGGMFLELCCTQQLEGVDPGCETQVVAILMLFDTDTGPPNLARYPLRRCKVPTWVWPTARRTSPRSECWHCFVILKDTSSNELSS